MKKFLFAIAAFVLIVISSSSCKKDTATVTYPIEGLWIGTASDSVSTSSYSSSFYADGTVLDKAVATGGAVYYSGGTWTLNGNVLTCTITSISPTTTVTQTQRFIYSNNGQLTSGTWIDTGGSNDNGTFSTMIPASK